VAVPTPTMSCAEGVQPVENLQQWVEHVRGGQVR
jgi:hypothetical protein